MANKFLNAMESPVMEAYYDILQLPITSLSVKKEYINTCPESEHVFIAKGEDILRQMDHESENVKVAGNIQMHTEHLKILEKWCLANYVSWFDICKTYS